MTFAELDAAADRLAGRLEPCGSGPGRRVALLMSRCPEAVVSILAVWKTGGAYVPVDPVLPAAMRDFILRDSAAVTIVEQAPAQAPDGVNVVRADGAPAETGRSSRQDARLRHADPAWVLYTSGSTGRPKGVEGPHRASLNRCEWIWNEHPFGSDEITVQNTGLAVVDSVWELWGSLGAGIPVLAPTGIAPHDAQALVGFLQRHAVTRLCLVPPLLSALLDAEPRLGARLPHLRSWTTSGAPLDQALVERFYTAAPSAVLLNQYGLTETCADVTSYDTRRSRGVADAGALVPIGQPIDGVDLHVLDEAMQPVPAGTAGELYVGGRQLALGYVGAPDLTAERFVAHPVTGARVYRTGDLVRDGGGGTLEYLGRLDRQLKIRGFRVEPEGVEAVLLAHPGVSAAAVTAHDGRERLAAFVVPARDTAPPSASELREHVAQALPAHMVPATITHVEALPRTASGKTDYAALPQPRERLAAAAYRAPAEGREQALADLWERLLQVDAIGADDDFFELGGDSLLTMRMLAAAAGDGALVAAHEFVAQPTVAALVRLLDRAAEALAGARAAADRPAITRTQEMMFLHERLSEAGGLYNIGVAFDVRGPVRYEALQRALDATVAGHRALRTCFDDASGTIAATVAPPVPCPLRRHRVHGVRAPDLEHLLAREAAEPFDLATPPLLRAAVFETGEHQRVLAVTVHHLACDGRSLDVLLRSIERAYASALDGKPVCVSEPPQASPSPRAAAIARTADVPQLKLPADRPRPARPDHRGASLDFVVDGALVADVEATARALAATPFLLACAALAVVLARHAQRDSFGISVPLADRFTPADDEVLGCLMRTETIHVDLRGDPTVDELVGRLRDELWRAQSGDAFASGAQRPPQVMLAFDDAHAERFTLRGAQVAPMRVPGATAKLDVTLLLDRAAQGWWGRLEYARALFDRPTMGVLADHFLAALRELCGDPRRRIDSLPMLGKEERALVVERWNETARPFPHDRCLHECIQDAIARAPGALVACGAERRTHGHIDAAANRIARRLRARGLGSGDTVAVHMQRSADLLVALLAVLKAGCAYLPLEPEQPPSRCADYVHDGRARLVITDGSIPFPVGDAPVVRFDAVAAEAADEPGTPPEGVAGPDAPAYVIFTSGSTGRPKGTVVSHRSIVNHLTWMDDTFALGVDDCVLLKTSIGFDVSLWELFWPFLANARVEIARPGGHRDPRYLARTIVEAGVTIVHFVPSMLPLFLDEPATRECASLRLVLAIGEALAPDVVERHWRTLDAELHNLYGPTEATVAITWWPCRPAAAAPPTIPIGAPIANCETYVLDAAGGPAPIGVAGELVLGGVQVAQGYVGAEELTRERFVAHPFRDGARVYRTGDLARWRPDGNLEFLGRRDRQVKIAGVRVEPGEVEVVLRAHPAVADAVVLPNSDEHPTALVAFIVPRGGATAEALRDHVAARLPAAMVPARVFWVEHIPKLANGKIDHRTLRARAPEPAQAAAARNAGGPERGSTSRRKAALDVWRRALRCDVKGSTSFVEAGGDSFLAIQCTQELNRLIGTALPTHLMLQAADFDAFVAEMNHHAASPRSVHAVAHATAGTTVTSPLQERWVGLAQRGFGHVEVLAEIRGPVDAGTFERAVAALARRHDVLHSVYEHGTPPLQHPVRRWEPPTASSDLRGTSDDEARRRVAAAFARSLQPFDVMREVPFAAELLTLNDDRHLLLLRLHHIATDGWSVHLCIEDLERVYAELEAGRDPGRLAAPPQYATFAAAQRAYLESETIAESRRYWHDAFSGCRGPIALPSDAPALAGEPSQIGRFVNLTLEPERAERLRSFARRQRATLFTVLTAGVVAGLAEISGERDVVLGVTSAGRELPGTERMLGVFVHPLPVRFDLRGATTPHAIHATADVALRGLARHSRYLLADMVRHAEPFLGCDVNDTFKAHIVFQNFPRDASTGPRRYEVFDFQDLSSPRPFGLSPPEANLVADVHVVGFERPDGSISMNFGYKPALISEAQAAALAACADSFFDRVLENPLVQAGTA